MNFLVVVGIVLLPVFAVSGSDYGKEQRWIEQVADFIVDGDVEMLPVGEREIFALYTEADDNPKQRAIIVLHGLGAHPDWEQVVQPVRVDMTQHGWNTLSVQMPVLPNGIGGKEYLPLFVEVPPRIEAAITFLKDAGMNEIVLVAHSLGSAMAAYYFAQNPDSDISRFVAVGLGNANNIDKIKIPVLDLYGSDDLPSVLETASARAEAAQVAKNAGYKQVVVQDAEHFFNGKNQQLIKQINDWLND